MVGQYQLYLLLKSILVFLLGDEHQIGQAWRHGSC